jgi:hypothetical protein
MKPAYYLILGNAESITRPFARYDSQDQAEAALARQRAQGEKQAHIIRAKDYRALTGRTAATDLALEEWC